MFCRLFRTFHRLGSVITVADENTCAGSAAPHTIPLWANNNRFKAPAT